MRIQSLLAAIFLMVALLPGSAISHTGHGSTGMSGVLDPVHVHPHLVGGAWGYVALIAGLGIAGLVFRRLLKA